MSYEVVNRFKDTEDNGIIYEVGESYPKDGHKPTKKRIGELTKLHPKYKVVFIEEVKEQQEE